VTGHLKHSVEPARSIVGSPDTVRAGLAALLAGTGQTS
jgi:alkanesulfonate monooxygenase SsuD/methylene tetrahydromethanopterin reductase-like flavin-dependent oxidoreductase (luciferase family)